MVVLGVANLLRVLAEVALGAQFGQFTALPFLFWSLSRASEVHREQASLAIALILVGAPAWFFHFRVVERAARASVVERTSPIRSFYVHAVVFTMAMLVFSYGQAALGLALQGLFFGGWPTFGPGGIGLDPSWQARSAGAAAMALAAAVVLAYHVRLSLRDKRAVLFTGRAAQLRHFAVYLLVAVGVVWSSYLAINGLNQVWQYVADQLVTPPGLAGFVPPSGFTAVRFPTREDFLVFQLLGVSSGIVAGLALWLGTWIPLQRGVHGGTPAAEIERRSSIRKATVYLIVLVAALAVLVGGTMALTSIIRRLLGDPIVERFSTLHREVGMPALTAVVFGVVWIFFRRVVAMDAALETERERAATIRRLYTYLVAGIGMAMLAIGLAGLIGVIGSQAMRINTHPNSETATYISIVLLGLPAWGLSWWQARRRLDDHERRSSPRRGYVYFTILAGVVGLLIFGAALLYRLLNATFAGSLITILTWHDIWHFLVDATVSAAVFLFHLRILRADRGAQLATAIAPHALTVVVNAPDAAAARARLAIALEGQADISIR
ncbi:MAG: hypothetical protein E6J13_01195 [Chloroflexi bacterium]|nr:MAG: hypothetical protein E6J13_01195 [Chloroflexota bacterium]